MVWKDKRETPGLVVLVVSVATMVGFMTAAALGNAGWATGLGVATLVTAVTGVGWILVGRRRGGRVRKHRGDADD